MKPFISFLCLLASALATSADEIKELKFGIISTESSFQLRKGFDPFVEQLSKNLGMPIKPFFATDYAGVIEAMRFGKIHVAWMGNKSGMEAVDRAGAEVIAQVTRADGAFGYHSLIIVKQDSPFADIDQIIAQGKELTFGNGDPNSTSGYLIPGYYLWSKRGINPSTHFKRSRSANHEANCLSVAMGQVDFATCNNEALSRFSRSRPDLAKRIRPIWESPLIPNDPILCKSDLNPDLKSKIKAALLAFGRLGPNVNKEKQILANVQDGWGPFLDSDNDQLIPIRELAIEKDVQSIRFNKRMPEEEKQKRIHELETKRASLQKFIEDSRYWNAVKTSNS